MSKTSRTTYRNKELEEKLGKIRYRIREIEDALAQQEIEESCKELEGDDSQFDELLQTYKT